MILLIAAMVTESGLILFADQAYVQAPLTFDLSTVKQLLNEAQLGLPAKKQQLVTHSAWQLNDLLKDLINQEL